MDFRLSDEQEMFRKSVRDYVNRELPKSWARELEKDERAFPHELFGKLAAAGFHAIGIGEEYGGQGGDIMTQMLLARELARSLAGLTWVWGITSFAGGKSVGLYGSEEQKRRHLPAIGIVQVVSAPDDYYVEVPAAFIQLKPEAAVTEEEIIDFCVGKIATIRVPRYVRFVTEWPMSGTKIKKAILREVIAADLKEKGITRAPKITIAS